MVQAYAYMAPAQAYKSAYAAYEAQYETHSGLASQATALHKDCEANKDMVELISPCEQLENQYSKLAGIKKLSVLKEASRAEYKAETQVVAATGIAVVIHEYLYTPHSGIDLYEN